MSHTLPGDVSPAVGWSLAHISARECSLRSDLAGVLRRDFHQSRPIRKLFKTSPILLSMVLPDQDSSNSLEESEVFKPSGFSAAELFNMGESITYIDFRLIDANFTDISKS